MTMRAARYRFIPLVVAGLLLAGQAQAQWWWPFGNKDEGLPYKVYFGGVDKDTQEWFETLNLGAPPTENAPANAEELEREATALSQQVRTALEARGYYDAQIDTKVTVDGSDGDAKGAINYTVQPGPRYTVGKVSVVWDGSAKPKDSPTPATKTGMPIDATAIIADGVKLEEAIAAGHCYLRLGVTPKLTLYNNRKSVDLAFVVRHGPEANFGATTIGGNERVKDKVVSNSIAWKQGECYQRQKIEDTRSALIGRNLFASVQISSTRAVDAKGEVPMSIRVSERVARTLALGGNYSTDEGPGLTAGWEHRNLFGGAEKFNADTSLSQFEQSLKTSLRIPDFWRMEQTLALTGNLKNEDRDAYSLQTLETGATLERPLLKNLKGGLGVGFTLTKTDDQLAGESNYALLSTPGFLTYDNRDNVLDSKRGIFANLSATPYMETLGDGGNFVKTQATGQTYLTAGSIPLSPTLALKASVGTIYGAKGANVPSDIRFHAGGGGSVRGYGYQTLGPRVKNEAVGGTSTLITSAEARLRFTDKIGGVAFVDAGNVYDQSTPDDRKLYYGSGVGIRYQTPIGPLRGDIAVPLNGKDIGAAGYAIYISIGQSF